MQYFDKVKVINEKQPYLDDNINVGDEGIIWLPEIRDNSFYVALEDNNGYRYSCIKIEDLELVEENRNLHKYLLTDLPKNDPHWWCKVENGYIMNLNGDKKNKIPYDYNS